MANELTSVEAAEQGHLDAMRELAAKSGGDPIQLTYPVKVHVGDDVYFSRTGCKFFKDEHDLQWISFIAANGPSHGKEHMLRTEGIIVVRDDGRSYLSPTP